MSTSVLLCQIRIVGYIVPTQSVGTITMWQNRIRHSDCNIIVSIF